MAIIVDKVQKRKDIALASKEAFLEYGINDLTMAQIAKTAGVGKGTLYDYFKNKEDIVFEIVNILIQKRDKVVEKQLFEIRCTKDKVKHFARFFYADEKEEVELRQLYKEFISINLSSPDEKMFEFQTECFNAYYSWFENLIEEGIKNQEILPSAKKLTKGFFITAKGMFIASVTTNSIPNLEFELNNYIDAIFELIEVKK